VERVCFGLVSGILYYSGLFFMFSNIYIYVYTICTKYFDKNNGYSTEYPWIKVGPPLPRVKVLPSHLYLPSSSIQLPAAGRWMLRSVWSLQICWIGKEIQFRPHSFGPELRLGRRRKFLASWGVLVAKGLTQTPNLLISNSSHLLRLGIRNMTLANG
jgi:hypothetical protein